MFRNKISKVKKRNGEVVDFSREKITTAIKKACYEVKQEVNTELIINIIERELFKLKGRIPNVEKIQDLIEEILINKGYEKTAKAYILYRQKRKELRELKEYYSVKDDLKLSLNSIKVLQSRYLLKDNEGNIIETPIEMFRRVAREVAKIDKLYNEYHKNTEEEFFTIMKNLEFIPNSPTLMNAGTRVPQLFGCFVLPIEDSLEEIFETLKISALIQKTGGGTGFSFSRLRQKGSIVSSTKGVSSGPVSFMSIFDKATDVIKQG